MAGRLDQKVQSLHGELKRGKGQLILVGEGVGAALFKIGSVELAKGGFVKLLPGSPRQWVGATIDVISAGSMYNLGAGGTLVRNRTVGWGRDIAPGDAYLIGQGQIEQRLRGLGYKGSLPADL